jgi:GTP-binding protein SAR1
MQRLSQHAPTQQPTSEELSIGRIRFKAFDLGGHRIARRVWKDYYAKVCLPDTTRRKQALAITYQPAITHHISHGRLQVDAVVYMVDAADGTRFGESKAELGALLSDDALAGVPFLVLGNKIDIPQAAPEHALAYYLGLAGCTTGKGTVDLAGTGVRPVEVFMCSVVRKMGYGEGFRWMSQYIK